MTITNHGQMDRLKRERVEKHAMPRIARWAHPSWVYLIPLIIQVPLLIISGRMNPDQMNPDLVSYLLMAQHYLQGSFHLAVNGYWGPLFSWLIVPVLALLQDPVLAARIVNGIGAVIYLIGGIRILRSFEFDRIIVLAGGLLIALFSIYWSTFVIEPDLLMSGLLLVGLSFTLASEKQGTG
ncbi:MAG: hypothetical protein L0287_38240, partial [Anaerolineae bacterium]|nr:hypothetical protein [Anaerolineae bacterium]